MEAKPLPVCIVLIHLRVFVTFKCYLYRFVRTDKLVIIDFLSLHNLSRSFVTIPMNVINILRSFTQLIGGLDDVKKQYREVQAVK